MDGDLDSIMAGLCCGEVCTVGWEILKHRVDYFFSCPDYVAADGMRVLGNPLAGDERIISGESGAVTSGLVYNLMNDPKLESFRKELGLGQDSVVLCLSTEGDTDKETIGILYGTDGIVTKIQNVMCRKEDAPCRL